MLFCNSKSKSITLYFFSNGRPYRQPYRLVGNKAKLDNYEMIGQSKRGELVCGNQTVYKLDGRPLYDLRHVKHNDAFVLVPCNDSFKAASYNRAFTEFLCSLKKCGGPKGKTHMSYPCDLVHNPHMRSRSMDKKILRCCSCCYRKKRNKSSDHYYETRLICETCGHNCRVRMNKRDCPVRFDL